MERRTLVAANWKMHGQKARIASLSNAILAGSFNVSGPEIVICPPSVYLDQSSKVFSGSSVALGAQNLYTEDSGAFTGEISAPMLRDFDCRFVIVGHSERRLLFNETDEFVAAKFVAAQAHALTPILCLGESATQHAAGNTAAVVTRQIEFILQLAGIAAFTSAVIAYEPVWAIGRGRAATPEVVQAVHRLLRNVLAQHDPVIAKTVRIIYGGSVNAANARDFSVQPDIDGALVGGASLNSEEFLAICSAFKQG